jgi:hypothetical protein
MNYNNDVLYSPIATGGWRPGRFNTEPLFGRVTLHFQYLLELWDEQRRNNELTRRCGVLV